VLIIPYSLGSQRAVLGSYQAVFWRRCRGLNKNNLPHQLGTVNKFSGTVAEEEEDLCKESLARTIFYFVFSFALLYFCLHHFIKNTKKN
jgi:hypothetical protein